ncbi:hypothetical protein EAF00_012034 [Botryotinia globosa]|nr:hypothetical protein EAF00_012034 [Botryotinia globosa]
MPPKVDGKGAQRHVESRSVKTKKAGEMDLADSINHLLGYQQALPRIFASSIGWILHINIFNNIFKVTAASPNTILKAVAISRLGIRYFENN